MTGHRSQANGKTITAEAYWSLPGDALDNRAELQRILHAGHPATHPAGG